jgi:hypothetical protein
MAFVADDLGAWLIGLLAEGTRRKLISFVLGGEVERALHAAATAAIELTATALWAGDAAQAEYAAMVINEVFHTPASEAVVAQQVTMLQALEAGIAGQLAVLDDVSLTGTEHSSADVLGVSAEVIANELTDNLLLRIDASAAQGGPLASLANLLKHDRTYMQGQETQDSLRQVGGQILDAIAQVAAAQSASAPGSAALKDVQLHVDQAFGRLNLGQHDEAERRLNRLFMTVSRDQQRAAVAAIFRTATTTANQTTQLVACSLLQAADRLDPMLISVEDVEVLARAADFSLRGCAAILLWQWAESIPGRVPIPLLGRLTLPSTEDWYVQSPARCAAKQLLLRREVARTIFDRMAASRDRTDRDYAVSDLRQVAAVEPRAVPRDLARKLANDEDEAVAVEAIELLRALSGLTDKDRLDYYGGFAV